MRVSDTGQTGDAGVVVSVVVCAYTERRFDEVLAAVASLRSQSHRPTEILLVVDHNAALARRLRDSLPPGIPSAEVLESTGPAGLSGARNTGIAAARGDLVAFLDDDARAQPGWLEGLVAAFTDPSLLAVGGRAVPRWPGSGRPGWFPPAFDWIVGCSFPGQPASAAPVRNLMGCNMGFRADALARTGGFALGLGRVGRHLLGCEETELCIRIRRAVPDGIVLFDPSLVVEHTVTSERTTRSYFLRRCFGEGRSKAAVSALVGAGEALESERRYLLQVLPRAALDDLRRLAAGDREAPERLAALLLGVATTTAGYLTGLVHHGLTAARARFPKSASGADRRSSAARLPFEEDANEVPPRECRASSWG